MIPPTRATQRFLQEKLEKQKQRFTLHKWAESYLIGPTLNKYGTNTLGTGQLNFRINILHQSQAYLNKYHNEGENRRKLIIDKLNSSALIKSVEQVVSAFKKARKNMIEARNNV